jgi:hypothetical protein
MRSVVREDPYQIDTAGVAQCLVGSKINCHLSRFAEAQVVQCRSVPELDLMFRTNRLPTVVLDRPADTPLSTFFVPSCSKIGLLCQWPDQPTVNSPSLQGVARLPFQVLTTILLRFGPGAILKATA